MNYSSRYAIDNKYKLNLLFLIFTYRIVLYSFQGVYFSFFICSSHVKIPCVLINVLECHTNSLKLS